MTALSAPGAGGAPCPPCGPVLPAERGLRRTGAPGKHRSPGPARWQRASDIQGRSRWEGAGPGSPGGGRAAPWAPAGPGRSRHLSTGKETRGCLSFPPGFLFLNKPQTRAQPAALRPVLPVSEPPRHRPGRAHSGGEGRYSRILTLRWSRRASSSSRAPRRRWSRALRWHRESASLRIPPKMSPAQRERSESCISSDTSAYELTCSSVPKSGTAPRRRPPPPSAGPAWSPGAGPPRSEPSPPASSNLHSFSGSRVRRGNGIAAGNAGQRGARQREGWRGELGVPGAKSLHPRSGRGDKSSERGEGAREREQHNNKWIGAGGRPG